MLEKDISVAFVREEGLFGSVYVFICRNPHPPKLNEKGYQNLLKSQGNITVKVMNSAGRTWWMYKGNYYWEDEGYSADQVKLEVSKLEMIEKLETMELGKSGEKFNEKMYADIIHSLTMDDIKMMVSKREKILQDLYESAKREYDDWVFKGKSAIEQAAKEHLNPGEDINNLEKLVGKIPVDFLGKGTFESSSIYKKWSTRIEEAERKLEHAKKILRVKTRERFGFPDIPEEQDESTSGGRDAIPDDVKMYVWKRDGGKCIKCGSQEKLEFDHIIPVSKRGSNTARNIQLLCEKCNRSKRDSIVWVLLLSFNNTTPIYNPKHSIKKKISSLRGQATLVFILQY